MGKESGLITPLNHSAHVFQKLTGMAGMVPFYILAAGLFLLQVFCSIAYKR